MDEQEQPKREEELQDLDLESEEGEEVSEQVRGGQRAISIPF